MKHKDPSFSIWDFRDWLEKQPTDELNFPTLVKSASQPSNEATAEIVESRLGISRLETEINKHNEGLEDIGTLAKCFKDNGGTIIESKNNLTVVIETKSGKFVLPRLYTKSS